MTPTRYGPFTHPPSGRKAPVALHPVISKLPTHVPVKSGTTLTAFVALMPSWVATIVATPALTAVTLPVAASAVATEGVSVEEMPQINIGDGIIGKVALTGDSHFSDSGAVSSGLVDPIVCIPLKIKDHVIGVLVIYNLLMQKEGFTDVDYELFSMLAGHAATAIFSAKLYTESKRKLNTIQGLIDLVISG